MQKRSRRIARFGNTSLALGIWHFVRKCANRSQGRDGWSGSTSMRLNDLCVGFRQAARLFPAGITRYRNWAGKFSCMAAGVTNRWNSSGLDNLIYEKQ